MNLNKKPHRVMTHPKLWMLSVFPAEVAARRGRGCHGGGSEGGGHGGHGAGGAVGRHAANGALRRRGRT